MPLSDFANFIDICIAVNLSMSFYGIRQFFSREMAYLITRANITKDDTAYMESDTTESTEIDWDFADINIELDNSIDNIEDRYFEPIERVFTLNAIYGVLLIFLSSLDSIHEGIIKFGIFRSFIIYIFIAYFFRKRNKKDSKVKNLKLDIGLYFFMILSPFLLSFIPPTPLEVMLHEKSSVCINTLISISLISHFVIAVAKSVLYLTKSELYKILTKLVDFKSQLKDITEQKDKINKQESSIKTQINLLNDDIGNALGHDRLVTINGSVGHKKKCTHITANKTKTVRVITDPEEADSIDKCKKCFPPKKKRSQ
jgi:uncharacterized protein YoxC